MMRRVIEIRIDEEPKVVDFVGEFSEISDFVGGMVQSVPLDFGDISIDLVLNEEGKLLRLPRNFVLYYSYADVMDLVVGNALIFGVDHSTGDWVGLSDDEIRAFFDNYNSETGVLVVG